MTFSEPVTPDRELHSVPVFSPSFWAGVDITGQLGADNTPAGQDLVNQFPLKAGLVKN